MKFFFILCLKGFFLFSLLYAQEDSLMQKDDSMTVNSGEAQYDGKEIILVGQVVVQHSLGQISAHRLSVQPSFHKEKKMKFGFLKMNDDVQIELRGGGKFFCQQAEVDYGKMQGVFLGNAASPDVTYLNKGEGTDSNPSFELKSTSMTLELLREPATSSSSTKTLVNQIEANQNVRVHYNQDYLLLADYALYQRLLGVESSSKAGILTLKTRGNLPACQMTNLNGDRLFAEMIQVDIIERKLWLTQPNGMLVMRREEQPAQILEFSSHELAWDDQQQTLQLKGKVKVIQNDTFHVDTDHELVISQTMIEGKRALRFLRSPKNTQISYFDAQKGQMHKIYCPGVFSIHHEYQEMFFQGLPNSTESKNENQQVYIEDVLGEMYADRVYINYTWENRQFVPRNMRLEGNVRLMNRFDGHLEESGAILHYALADRVEYFPKQQEMVLASENGNRVLFFDKVNNVQMSAPSLKIHHDLTTKKEKIQGLGDVRFTFIEKEFEKFKQQFP